MVTDDTECLCIVNRHIGYRVCDPPNCDHRQTSTEVLIVVSYSIKIYLSRECGRTKLLENMK